MKSLIYLGFVDGASHHTWNFTSSACVVYSPKGLLVSSGGACLWPSTNNVAEYIAIIELLCDASILSLKVHLDSQLVVCQWNGRYRVCDPNLHRRFLRVRPFRTTI